MNTDVIDKILAQDNFLDAAWIGRGLNPSDGAVKQSLDTATKDFLTRLRSVVGTLNAKEMEGFVSDLVDELPWFEFDTEEKSFLADVLAPAIQSVGLDPWKIF